VGETREGSRGPRRPVKVKRISGGVLRSLARSFGHAWSGLSYVYRTQTNMRIHVLFAVLVGAACIVLGVGQFEVFMVSVAIAGVLVAEVTNTLAESLTDLMEPRFSRMAKVTKDVAAAGVLLAAAFSIVIGIAVFLPLLPELPARLYTFWRDRFLYLGIYTVVAVVPAVLGTWKGEG
jgi:undecaprenol kinase